MTMAQQDLTVRHLVDMPTLGQRVVAGSAGLDRVVLWAHSCELDDPWHWLGPHELLMTVGLCVPRDAAAQVAFIRHLSAAGLAGVTIGDDAPAPSLSTKVIDEADRIAFPILRTSLDVPFIRVSRTVALAGDARHQQQLHLLDRLYRALTSVNAPTEQAIQQMERLFGVELVVVDLVHRGVVLAGSLAPDRHTVDTLCERALGTTAPLGSMLRAPSGIRARQLATSRRSLLLLRESAGPPIDAFSTGHLVQAVTAGVDGLAAYSAAHSARAEQVCSALLLGNTPPAAVMSEAAELGFHPGHPLVSLAVTTDHSSDVLAALSAARVPHLPRRTNGRVLCCIPADREVTALGALSEVVPRAGVSAPFDSLTALASSFRDAAWALESALPNDRVVRVGNVRDSIIPRDAGRADELIKAVLGPLLEHDERSRKLLKTLTAFLGHDRNWITTAEALGVHRQTLAYRLRRIQELTGRDLKSTADIATLWVAVTAVQQAVDGGDAQASVTGTIRQP